MSKPIETYALLSNCETTALVGSDGSVDWLGMPRFDSESFFSALLGHPEHGRWLIAPTSGGICTSRQYRGDSMILETTFESEEGSVRLVDFMARGGQGSHLVRMVEGVCGRVRMRTELVVRYGYASVVPWATRRSGRIEFVGGPDRLVLDTALPLQNHGLQTSGEFTLEAGGQASFVLTWSPSFREVPERLDAAAALANVETFWSDWIAAARPKGDDAALVRRSLLTLKALTHWETGGIVAASTTSLPEKLGGTRNWDYCWLRDATFTLYALLGGGFVDEAEAWRQWLLRAVGGSPDKLQIMYGIAGERRLNEFELPSLPGYENSQPVRVGNAASGQLQLDVYGEVLDALYVARKNGLDADAASWTLECALVAHLETIWEQPDEGIWEVRGGRRHFTHSKVMAWVAFDRAVRSIEEFQLDGPVGRWKRVRADIHAEVCAKGFDATLGSFTQSYGEAELDASLLLIPMVGFLPASDPRVQGTLAAIERDLLQDGLLLRYRSRADGLPAGEGAFLACSFWLADNYILQGRMDDARALFDRLKALCNDVGLLSEEYDPVARRQLGNFPQAFSHLALINTAHNLTEADGPAQQRAG